MKVTLLGYRSYCIKTKRFFNMGITVNQYCPTKSNYTIQYTTNYLYTLKLLSLLIEKYSTNFDKRINKCQEINKHILYQIIGRMVLYK